MPVFFLVLIKDLICFNRNYAMLTVSSASHNLTNEKSTDSTLPSEANLVIFIVKSYDKCMTLTEASEVKP
jgi:hypothetical protein